MSKQAKLYLNLYWHMHQPDYRDLSTGEFVLPWTYLHALKDYADMAYHVEKNPQAKASFNFVPILVEQLQDYVEQCKSREWREPLLRLLDKEDLTNISDEECHLIADSCFKAHHEKMLAPFAHYQSLHSLFETTKALHPEKYFAYLSGQYKADLLMWYHLAWTGESVRRENKTVQRLMQKGQLFSWQDRRDLVQVIIETLTALLPRYQRLLASKQIEITTTPYHHPIVPLLIDFKSTLDAMPDAPLPKSTHYPDGEHRARSHIIAAQHFHQQVFGEEAKGMWPAEGAVSLAGLSLMAEQKVQWAATGQGVLANSLNKSHADASDASQYLYQPYVVSDGAQSITCFFRDDALSDKIGFEYAKMFAGEAVRDFISHLEHILNTHPKDHPQSAPIVSVILDGENAWEYYPYNGYYFLSELYQALAVHPTIQMTTFTEVLNMQKQGVVGASTALPQVAAGSWVYGTFSTWIGSDAKNRAWDLLCDAKQVYDQVFSRLSNARQAECERQLAICEGSDWFWWFGDYNSADSVQSFDQLYRRNLTNLYHLLEQPPPAQLSQPICLGGGDAENSGTMRRGSA